MEQRFEHLVVPVKGKTTQNTLKLFEKVGWELVAVTCVENFVDLYFKRPVQNPDTAGLLPEDGRRFAE